MRDGKHYIDMAQYIYKRVCRLYKRAKTEKVVLNYTFNTWLEKSTSKMEIQLHSNILLNVFLFKFLRFMETMFIVVSRS